MAPVDALVWVLVGIFSLNVIAVGWLVTMELVERHRLNREIKEVDALWRSLTTPLSAAAVWAGRHRSGRGQHAPSIHKLPLPARPVGRASVGIALAAALVWVAAALGPGDRRAITSADSFLSAASPQASRRIDVSFARGGQKSAGTFVATQSPGRGAEDAATATSDDEAVPATVAAEPHSSTAIYVDWAGVPAATGYAVDRREKDTGQGFLQIVRVGEEVTAYTDAGLDSDTTYFYRVTALTDSGAAPHSDVVSATTPTSPPAATSLTAVSALDAIALTWVDVADETGYRIERSVDGTTDWMEIGTTGQDVTAYTDVALSPGTYHYRIVATNSGGDSAPSNVATATVEPAPIVEEPPKEEPQPSGTEGAVGEAPPGTDPSEGPAPTP